MVTRAASRVAVSIAVMLGASCTGVDDTGTASIRIVSAPTDVYCVRITAVGARTVSRSLPVTPGETTVFQLRSLPVGSVTFSGEAFALECDLVVSSTEPSWLADPVTETISSSSTADVLLAFRRNGRASVTADFIDDPDGGVPSDGGAATTLCYPDVDGDGYRTSTQVPSADGDCTDPGEATDAMPAGDCCDTDPDAHPGQTQYRSTALACGGFDWDCDGYEERQYTDLGECVDPICQVVVGWAEIVPSCGNTGQMVVNCAANELVCQVITTAVAQPCQ